ncbi:hypothetical protein [Alkalilimnicola ehrlichii]|nr:hypothetical protein [Alkalilimnicola ehrlichii]
MTADTVIERRSQYVVIQSVERRQADAVTEAVVNQLGPLSPLVHTITLS